MACRTRAPGSKLPGFPCAPYHWHACEAQHPQLASPHPLFSVARGQPSGRPENFPLCKRTFLEPVKTQYACLVCVPTVSCDMTVSERVKIGTPRLEGDPFSLKDPLKQDSGSLAWRLAALTYQQLAHWGATGHLLDISSSPIIRQTSPLPPATLPAPICTQSRRLRGGTSRPVY